MKRLSLSLSSNLRWYEMYSKLREARLMHLSAACVPLLGHRRRQVERDGFNDE